MSQHVLNKLYSKYWKNITEQAIWLFQFFLEQAIKKTKQLEFTEVNVQIEVSFQNVLYLLRGLDVEVHWVGVLWDSIPLHPSISVPMHPK